MKHSIKSFFIMFCTFMLIFSTLTGCSPNNERTSHYKGTEEEKMEQVIDDFIVAIDDSDPDAIKQMLSPNVQASDGIDTLIQELLDFYPGKTERVDWDGNVGAYYSKGEDHRFRECSTNITMFSGGTAYYCQLELRYLDMDEGGVGVRRITLATEEAVCDEEFSWTQESGIFLFNDTDGDYLTRRVGGDPFIYTPMERTITEEDILDFVVTNSNYDDFTDTFGDPNGDKLYGLCPVYELSPVDGESRYAVFMLQYEKDFDRWQIEYIEIKSAEDFLYDLWCADDK